MPSGRPGEKDQIKLLCQLFANGLFSQFPINLCEMGVA